MKQAILTTLLALALAAAAGCKGDEGKAIKVDGSSTVFPITQAVAEEFEASNDVRVTVGVSGTGGGFKKFCRSETTVTGASRPIKPTEVKACADAGVEFIELPIAYDGIAVVVHPDNDWAKELTVEELKKIWEPAAEGKITRWNQVRSEWPDKELHLFGPGIDSGTYDYFTHAIAGKEGASRGDFNSSEDDNVLVQGVSTDPNALGFFGYAYYAENKEKLSEVAIDDGDAENGEGGIKPTLDTVAGGTYQPLSRPLFIYVSKKAAKDEKVQKLVAFYLDKGPALVKEVGYVPLPDKAYKLVGERFEKRTAGSLFEDGAKVGVTVEELLSGS